MTRFGVCSDTKNYCLIFPAQEMPAVWMVRTPGSKLFDQGSIPVVAVPFLRQAPKGRN